MPPEPAVGIGCVQEVELAPGQVSHRRRDRLDGAGLGRVDDVSEGDEGGADDGGARHGGVDWGSPASPGLSVL